MPGNTISLAEVATRAEVLAVACGCCDRRGRLHVARLVTQHGGAMPMTALLRFLTQDCPRHGSMSVHRACGAHFPELAALFSVGKS